jgi:endoglucanase
MSSGPTASVVGELVGGKYKIVRLLARGGMGVVYEAQHTVVRRRFAIKFLRRDLADRRDILNRFQREAEAAGALENENVTAAVDFGITDDGTPYIVMEYLVGESLAALLERVGSLPVSRAADLVSQACRGVEVAHNAGIVHRDLKPHNLFVCRRDDGTDLLKILDFGVAKLQAIDDASLATRSGVVLGTAAYMSPEQARGEKMVDRRADVYALGAILYELVSQRKPHPGDSQNAILHHIATQPAVPLGAVQPDLGAELLEIVGRALASDPGTRPQSAEALAQGLAPFARREVWPAPPGESGPIRAELTSTVLAPGDDRRGPSAPRLATATPTVAGEQAPAMPGHRRLRALLAAAAVIAAGVLAIVVWARWSPGETAPKRPAIRAARTLDPTTRFYVPPPKMAAVQQIAGLAEARALRDAGLLTALQAIPRAVWFDGGSPEDVEGAVRKNGLRAAHDGGTPVLVAYDLPYRDCAQYAAGGARDGAAYRAWIEAFARGIGNQKAIVILEPDSLGIIPYNTMLDGSTEWCKPTVTDGQGKAAPAPGATADEHYALLASAIDRLASSAPNALVYLDGSHSAWLSVGEIASRLAKVGVDRTQGFAVNVANERPTPESIKYGTWISKCLAYASRRANKPAAFRDCPSGHRPGDPIGAIDWETPERWYVDNVDHDPQASSAEARAHFVVETSRSGRGPLEAAIYAAAPFNQPPEIIAKIALGGWCNPPSCGVGLRPTARTGFALLDAFLWIKPPGDSDGSCDYAGGARAWDYTKYNPWGIAGETQKHFDPLWGMVDPESGEWFPEHALKLARNANPPLEQIAPSTDLPPAVERTTADTRSTPESGAVARPAERPPRRALGRPSGSPGAGGPAPPAPELSPARDNRAPPPVTLDQQNPYN